MNYVQTTGLHKIFTNSTFTEFTSDAIASGVNSDSIIYIICQNDTSLGSEFTDGKTLIWAKGNFYAGDNKLDILLPVTYDELKQLRDTNMLVPGQQYRITDYKTTCATNTYNNTELLFRFDCRVADTVGYTYNYFDIIVTADTNNTLNENARACSPSSTSASTDSKYTSQKFSKWRLKYLLDNDTTYRWATSTGKGVIYYMEDEWGNTSCYDFKNIVMRPYMIDHTKLNNHNVANNYMGSGNPQTIFTKTTKYLYTFGVIDTFSSCTDSLSVGTIQTADGTLSGSTHKYSNCKNDSLFKPESNTTYYYIPMNFMIVSLTFHTSASGTYYSSLGCWNTDFRNSTSCSIICINTCHNTSITDSQNIDLYSLNIYENNISTTRRVSIISQDEYMTQGWIFKISMQGAGGHSTFCCSSHLKSITLSGELAREIRIFASSIQNNEFIGSNKILIDANANSKEPTTSRVGYILYNSFSHATNITIKSGNVFSNKFNAGDYYTILTTSNSNSFNNPWHNYFFYGANYGTADNFKEISLPSGEVNINVVGKNVQYIQID